MFGYVEWSEPQRGRAALQEQIILHVRFCRVRLPRTGRTPEWLLRRRAGTAAGRMRKLGITRAVFPDPFPLQKEFERKGIRPVAVLPLYRALAAPLVRAALDERGLSAAEAVVAVSADRLGPEVIRAVTELCIRNRYVTLIAPNGEELCRRLRREYGAALVLTQEARALENADVRVLFTPSKAPEGNGPVLNLWNEAEPPRGLLRLSAELERQIPDCCNRPQLFSALFQAGALRAEQVEISTNRTFA